MNTLHLHFFANGHFGGKYYAGILGVTRAAGICRLRLKTLRLCTKGRVRRRFWTETNKKGAAL